MRTRIPTDTARPYPLLECGSLLPLLSGFQSGSKLPHSKGRRRRVGSSAPTDERSGKGPRAMPMYEFRCEPCEHAFETLVRSSSEVPHCPKCKGTTLLKQFSVP